MKTVAIVQARLRSTRLPGKILLPLPTGRTVLEEVVYRCREARRVHQVVVAVPDSEECDLLLPFTGGATVVRGPEADVLARYSLAAETVGADIIVRVTSDCPAIPSEMIDAVIERRNVHALPYACNVLPETWPKGYACEAFTINELRKHVANSWSAEAREHVTWNMRRSLHGRLGNVACPDGDFSHIGWTLDTIDDYVRICKAFEGAKGASNLLDVVRA
jgi:spore coat polysaccharide biosynthesis protein SpsF